MKKRIISALTSLAMSASFIIGTLPASVQTMQAAAADITYTIADVEGEAGADVDVPITIKGNDTGTAGMVLELSADSNLKLKRRMNGNAYEGAPTWNATTLTYVWNAGDGRNLEAKDGAVLTTLKFTVPADAQPGDEFPVNLTVNVGSFIDANKENIPFETVNGWIKIKEEETTTSEETTTTTTTTTTEGAAETSAPAVTTSAVTTTKTPDVKPPKMGVDGAALGVVGMLSAAAAAAVVLKKKKD